MNFAARTLDRRSDIEASRQQRAKMSKFYFNVDEERPDAIGVDLPDRKAARAEAIRAAAEILRDIDGAMTREEWRMFVRDETGEFVLEIRFLVTERAGE